MRFSRPDCALARFVLMYAVGCRFRWHLVREGGLPIEAVVTLTNEAGLHARPAALFVQTAGKFQSAITVKCGAKQGNAKSMLSLLSLGAKKGAEVAILADGPDAAAAVETLVNLVRSGLE